MCWNTYVQEIWNEVLESDASPVDREAVADISCCKALGYLRCWYSIRPVFGTRVLSSSAFISYLDLQKYANYMIKDAWGRNVVMDARIYTHVFMDIRIHMHLCVHVYVCACIFTAAFSRRFVLFRNRCFKAWRRKLELLRIWHTIHGHCYNDEGAKRYTRVRLLANASSKAPRPKHSLQ